ncbi:MAG: class I SAM-dependent methyltransferase [Rhodospirillales bacterium]|nr:class I SAM-dependent methyltransferase [Rhodospirillales bacterium]
MTDQGNISGFWAKGDTLGRILDVLDKAGLSLDTLSIHDLAPVDHLHARGLPATVDLADRLSIARGQHILDIGCAVGGPARYMAERFGCRVSGIDITPGFIEAGEELNRLTGMVDRVDLRVGDGATLPYEDSLFDGAYTQHVTMNVADRAAFFAEAFRVLKPGGFFALSEHSMGPEGDPIYPLPWADEAATSFLITRTKTEALLSEAGFERIETVDTGPKYVDGYRNMLARIEVDGPPILGLHVVGGDDIAVRAANSTRSIEEGRTFPIEVVCTKPG